MANSLYGLGREAFLGGDGDWDATEARVTLVDAADYTIALTTHDFFDDIPGAARVAESTALLSKTKTLGTADAADITWTAVTGDPSEYVNLRFYNASEPASRLIGNFDTATGLPVTPNGGNINLVFNASGIFTL
jgi:hypothetical protein